jgi:rSAM/selenodomain-associated transferase 1
VPEQSVPKSSKNALLIFIKNPKKGTVKTRLAATIGEDEALQVYHKLLDYTRYVALQVDTARQLWYSRFIAEDDAWKSQNFDKHKQIGESLGERMRNAFEQAFEEGFDKAVIIGSDCAQLQAEHIEQTYRALDDHEVVIGPSEDGGYYLLGMNRFLPELFEGKQWSTPQVFEQTVDDCKEHGLGCHILQELNDVDTEADWQQVKDRFE